MAFAEPNGRFETRRLTIEKNLLALATGKVHSADGWQTVLKPVVARYHGTVSRL